MEQQFEGILAEISARAKIIEAVLAGRTPDTVPEGIENTFSGMVTDFNSDSMIEIEHMKFQMEKLLGSSLGQADVVAQFRSSDGQTIVNVYAKPLGSEGSYYLSNWYNNGEKELYVLWPKEMYDAQLIGDDETEAPFGVSEGEWE